MKNKKGKKRGAPKLKYTASEEKFYKENKEKIMEGLSYVPKNQIKRIFFGSVREEQKVNHVSKTAAMKKVLRSRTFSTAEENFEYYKSEVIDRVFKGKRRDIKKHLGMSMRNKLTTKFLSKTDEGWAYIYNGKSVILTREDDTKTDGYKLIFA